MRSSATVARGVVKVAVRAILIAYLSLAGACDTKRCAGVISCARVAAVCQSVPGCSAVPACQYSFTAVDSTCEKRATPFSCESETLSACMWSGSRCLSACGSIADSQACDDFSFTNPQYPASPDYPCVWSTCSGVPAKPSCGDYAVDQC